MTASYIAVALGVLAVVFLIGSISAIRKRAVTQLFTNLVLSMMFLFVASFFALGAISIKGYHALTHEQPVATIMVEPIGNNRFKADFIFAHGEQKSFEISGNQLSVEAHVLKFKPIANILGLHTSFELARVLGRYSKIEDEMNQPRTVFPLKDEDKLVDLFELRKKFSRLNVLLDAEYGSGSFVPATQKQQYLLLITTSGLIFRKITP